MDDSVIRALARWPNVPAVYGWLSLSRRGDWLIRGERIPHRAARAFIQRNYAGDERGRWYFQNGPQRVYVSLAYTPWVISFDHDARLVTHTGETIESPQAVWLDDEGSLLMKTEFGVGVVDDRELEVLSNCLLHADGSTQAERLEQAIADTQAGRHGDLLFRWGERIMPVESIQRALVARRFGFNPEPEEDDPNDG